MLMRCESAMDLPFHASGQAIAETGSSPGIFNIPTASWRMTLAADPDFTVYNRYGGTALIPACERGHVEVVRYLLTESKVNVNHINNLGWTCLLEIVILGDGGPRHVEVAKLVLGAGADPNIADRDGVRPVQHARQRGQRDVAALIEAAGGR